MIDYDYEDRLVDRIAVNEVIAARLNQRQRRVLLRYTRYGETYREIAHREGVSVERIRQLHFRAIDKLCRPLVAEPLKQTTRTEPPPGFDKAAFRRHMRLLIDLREQRAKWERQEQARREREEIERREREERWRLGIEQYELETARLRKQNEFAIERAELARLIAGETVKKAPPPPIPTKDQLCATAHAALDYLLTASPQQYLGNPWLGKWCTSVVFTRDGGAVSEAVNSIMRELPAHARLSAFRVPVDNGTLGANATTPYASLRVTVTPDGLKLRFDVTWD